MVLCFICRMKRNRNEVCALDANKLLLKIIEAGLSAHITIELCNSITNPEKQLTIGDALLLKELLNLTNLEAIDIFLS